VPRFNFQGKDFEIVQPDQVRDPSQTNRAVSIRYRMFSVMSELVKRVILTVRRSLPVFPEKRTISEPVGTSDLSHVAVGFFIRPLP
jgi:hypothetical protein